MQIHIFGFNPEPEMAHHAEHLMEHIGDHFVKALDAREAPIELADQYIYFSEDFTALLWGTKEAMTILFIEAPFQPEYTEH